MRTITPKETLGIMGGLCALGLVYALGLGNGTSNATRAYQARPTPTPAIIVRTRLVVVTATPVPPPPGPQHHLAGATYCDRHLCVRPVGYTLRAAPGEGEGWTSGHEWKRLDVWFHVENQGLFDDHLMFSNFKVAIQGYTVRIADDIPDEGSANIVLVAKGATEGKETFDVPAASHAVNLRFGPYSFFGDKPLGSWGIRY